MSMARLTFPSRLELNRPKGSFSAAPFANVIWTTFLYVSPVHTTPPWEKTGVPIHFHSSTISGSAWCMIARTFASVFPRQSPSSLIFSSMNAEADSTGTALFMCSSNSRTQFSCAQRNPKPPEVKASSGDRWPTQARFWLEWGCSPQWPKPFRHILLLSSQSLVYNKRFLAKAVLRFQHSKLSAVCGEAALYSPQSGEAKGYVIVRRTGSGAAFATTLPALKDV